MKFASTLFVVASIAASASAGIDGVQLGTSAPPADLVGRPLTPAPFDSRIFSDVTSIPDGLGGNITTSIPVSVRQIGLGWASWSQGYTGNVYYTNGATDITVSFAAGTQAAYLYAEPNPFGVFNITATGSDGVATKSFSQGVEGSAGAAGWGFYGTSGSDVQSVRVTSDVDFAVGEFGTSKVPTPASLALLTLGGLVGSRRRRA